MILFAVEEDLAFVRSSWLASYADSAWARYCTPGSEWRTRGRAGPLYWEGQRARIERLIESCTVLVSKGDDEMIDGWACGTGGPESPVVHYVYTRQSCRGQGIARALVMAVTGGRAEFRFSHMSKNLDLKRLPKGVYWQPYLGEKGA